MKKLGIWLALLMAGLSADAQTWYKAVYMQTYGAETAPEETSSASGTVYRYLEFHVDERYSYCAMADYRDAELKKADNEKQKLVGQAEWIPTAALLDYKDRKGAALVNRRPSDIRCWPLQENITAISPLGQFKKIGDYDCQGYTAINHLGNPVTFWTTKQLPWFVNCGLYLPQVKEGIVAIEVNEGDKHFVYRLINLEKRNGALEVPEIKCN
jgi:hypothetical protein